MCGIAGWMNIDLAPDAARAALSRMCSAMIHRGPDDNGAFFGERVALGMQRLSIVDIAGGHQPMASDNGAVQVIFNGEIYNHDEERDRLRTAGMAFRTRSDTEVILRAYEHGGLNGFSRFNGMFAIAIWDGRSQELHLVRDRLGVKPLYYARTERGIVFASEIKAILASGLVAREINERAIWDYLTLRYVPTPHTMWRNVFKLTPAHRLTIKRNASIPAPARYWDMPFGEQPYNDDDTDLLKEFTSLFEDSVDKRMVADVPVGIMLSGGLDSSAVAAAASRNSKPVETFSVAFADAPAIDEREHARSVASRLGTRHSDIVIDERQFLDFLPELVHLTDEPLADLASVPLYYVSRLARGSVKVALSGEGADEILGGYTFDRWAERWDRAYQSKENSGALGRLADKALSKFSPEAASRRSDAAVETDLRRLPVPLAMTDFASSKEKARWLRHHSGFPDSQDNAREALARIGSQHPLNQALYVYCQDWLVEDLLMKADRMSMANSLELRTPFLDYRLVEFAWKLPPSLKAGREDDGRYATKQILRQYARSRLPKAIIERPKLGFPVPVYEQLGTRFADWAKELLAVAKLRKWLTDEAIASLLAAGTAPDADTSSRHRLWNLLILELWMRRWLS